VDDQARDANYGLRFDYHNAYVPPLNAAGDPVVAAQSYAGLYGVPAWKDIDRAWASRGTEPARAGAWCGQLGPVRLERVDRRRPTANSPLNTRVNSGFRLWNDTNGNFFPDCNLTSTAANGECGGLSTPLGQVNTTTTWDPRSCAVGACGRATSSCWSGCAELTNRLVSGRPSGRRRHRFQHVPDKRWRCPLDSYWR